MTVPKCIIENDGNKNILRTIETQIVQKLKNNEARPKFTGSYKKKGCNVIEFPLNINILVKTG